MAAYLIAVAASLLGLSDRALAFACTISATNIAFGSVDVLTGGAVASTGTLSLSCSGSPSNQVIRMCVDIDGGVAFDGTSRKMNSGANQLRYQLYTDAARTTPWGSWSDGIYSGGFTWDVLSTMANMTATMPVYGLVLGSQQTAAIGSYSSTLGLYFTYNNKDDKPCPDKGKGNSSSTFSATATVVSSCNVSATNLNFGSTSILASNIDAASSVSVQCTNSTPYTVSLNGGNSGATDPTQRKMSSGGNQITYGLYRDAGRSLAWGNNIGSNTLGGTGTGSAQALTVYGRVAPQSTPPAATYQDTIVVTITY